MKIGLLLPAVGSGASRVKKAFTLIELLVVIAIIAILAAILFPVFAQAREKARQTACLSNTKQIGLGIYQYVQDYDEVLPMGGWGNGPTYGGRWFRDIYPYVKNVGVYTCPSETDDKIGANATYFRPTLAVFPRFSGDTERLPQSPGGYGINTNLVGYPYAATEGAVQSKDNTKTLADIKDSAGTFLVCETTWFTGDIATINDPVKWLKYPYRGTDWQVTPPTDVTCSTTSQAWYSSATNTNYLRRPAARHNGGLNVIYCDGHAKWSKAEQFLGPLSATEHGWACGDPRNSWDLQ